MALCGTFQKQVGESYNVEIDYTGRLPSGLTIASGTVSAIDMATQTDKSSLVLASTTATILGGLKAQAGVMSGIDKTDYRIEFILTLSDGSIIIDELMMEVRNT